MGSEHLRLPETVSQNRYNQSTSTHLGEILKLKEDHHSTRNNLTIGNVLNLEKRSSPGLRSGRTLLDIIQADSTGDSKITWRNFREKVRLKRASAALQRTNSINNNGNNQMTMLSTRIPTSDPDIDSQSTRIRSSSSLRLQTSLGSLTNEDFPENDLTPRAREEEEEEETEGEGPLRMSLMSLLAETDREMGIDSAYVMEDEGDQGEVEVENGDYNDCCVCMVRHKGSAFIPCGHTFCRLCSRELYAQRGNCPICNGFISEILDIF